MARFHGLTAANPQRKTVAEDVEHGCESLLWQVRHAQSSMSCGQAGRRRHREWNVELRGSTDVFLFVWAAFKQRLLLVRLRQVSVTVLQSQLAVQAYPETVQDVGAHRGFEHQFRPC